MIRQLTDRDLGRWVYYEDFGVERQGGRLKSYDNGMRRAWVVFKCSGQWENYRDYTGEPVDYSDLVLPESLGVAQ